MSNVTLRPALRTEAPILANLLELYSHDLSVYFPIEIGPDGRFGYKHLPLYFEQPETRHAFFISLNGKLAGFAFATRGSPASEDPSHLDVAELFVLRSLRKQRVGERAAALLWDRIKGHWWIRVAAANTGALAFWRNAAQRYAGKPAVERALVMGGIPRVVLELDSR